MTYAVAPRDFRVVNCSWAETCAGVSITTGSTTSRSSSPGSALFHRRVDVALFRCRRRIAAATARSFRVDVAHAAVGGKRRDPPGNSRMPQVTATG
jgi:hypothetical protein